MHVTFNYRGDNDYHQDKYGVTICLTAGNKLTFWKKTEFCYDYSNWIAYSINRIAIDPDRFTDEASGANVLSRLR